VPAGYAAGTGKPHRIDLKKISCINLSQFQNPVGFGTGSWKKRRNNRFFPSI
jgi:hypothetical protein